MNHNKRVVVEPATLDHFKQFYGYDEMPYSARGKAFYLDGELVAVAGVRFVQGYFLVFSEIKPDVKVEKATIFRCGLEVMDMVKSLGLPVIAVAGNGITAPRFLKHLGFTQSPCGEYYYYG